MIFSGKELHELGVPKNRIKFFIGKDFSSKEQLLAQMTPTIKNISNKPKYTWIDWLMDTFPISHMPLKMNGTLGEPMSKSELRRLFDSKSIRINGVCFSSNDECCEEHFPINDFVWFPNGKRKTTWH